MSSPNKELVPQRWIPNTPTAIYTASAAKITFDKTTTTNRSAAMVDVTAYIVASGDSAAEVSAIKTVSLTPGQCYLWAEIAGKTIDIGSSIWFGATAASAVNIGISGRWGN